MEAFLLLDEKSLQDIGVSTIGARKKLFNAIISTVLVDLNWKILFSISIDKKN